MAKITVSATSGRRTENYQRIQVNKILRVCGTCGNRLPAQKPYGVIYVPTSLSDLREITIKIREEEKKDE